MRAEFKRQPAVHLRRQSIRLAIRAAAAIGERGDAAILVALEDLVTGLPRDPDFGAQRRHLLALPQTGDKPEPFVHDVTLLPRHAPSAFGGKVSPMCPEYRVTYVSGRTEPSKGSTVARALFLERDARSEHAARRP